jgi:hypothetical protein
MLEKASRRLLRRKGVVVKVRDPRAGLLALIAKRIRILEPSMVAGVSGLVLDQKWRKTRFLYAVG